MPRDFRFVKLKKDDGTDTFRLQMRVGSFQETAVKWGPWRSIRVEDDPEVTLENMKYHVAPEALKIMHEKKKAAQALKPKESTPLKECKHVPVEIVGNARPSCLTCGMLL